ncbi:MAG: hypothetical protein ACXADY_14910 [Candidatus Hodarchaeales archaeon]|jgi:hypothetical protein
MASDKMNLISEILTKINKLLSKPVCAPELTKLSKLVQQYAQLEKEARKAGRLAKRGLKKQQEQLRLDIADSEEACLQCIFSTLLKDLKPRLETQIQALSGVAPQASSLLRNLSFPMTSEIDTISSFLEEVKKVQADATIQTKTLCKVILDANQSKINIYKDLISLDQSQFKHTKILTEDTLNSLAISDLLKSYSALKKEEELINQQLAASSETVQEKLLLSAHELIYSIQEGAKRKIIPDIKEYQEIKEVISQIEVAKSIAELNQLNSKISQYITKYKTTLKSETTRTRTTTNNLIIQIRGMFPTLSDKWMALPPESSTKASITELMSYSEKMNKWENKILEGVKKLASVEEMKQVTEGALQEGVSIPNTLLANATENANQVQEEVDINEAVRKLKTFQTYYSEFLSILRDRISDSLSLDFTDSDSTALISLKPPSVKLQSDSPSELLSYLRAVNIWKNRLVNVLQETRHAVNDTIINLNQLEKKGISNFPPNFQAELSTLYEKMASESEVQTLLLYRRSYERLNKQFVTLTGAFIKDFLKDVIVLQLLESDSNIPRPPFVGDASELDLSELLTRIEDLEEWKRKVILSLKNKIDTLTFPMIPGEVPVDLRKEKNTLITQLTGTAACRNFTSTIRAYFNFVKTMSSSTNLMIEETLKQIDLMERINQSSMKYFNEVIGSDPIFQIPRDLEALDYSELLELWFRLYSYNNKRTELVQLKCREILSSWLKQYKSLPAHYLSIFNPLFLILDQALSELNQSLGAEEALTRFEFYLSSATSKSQECLEKLKAYYYNKVTVSLPRITEVIGEVSPEIHKVYNFLESTISTKDQTLESIHRLVIETIHDYEYVLLAKLMELLSISSRNLLMRIAQLQSYKFNLQNLVGEQIEVFTQLVQADSSDMMSIEMITQSFVELDKILVNETLQKSLYEIIEKNNDIAGRIFDFIQALGWKNTQHLLMPHVVAIKQAKGAIQFWSFDLIAKSAIEILKRSKELIQAIRQLEQENFDIYLSELETDPKLPYYKSIYEVFKFQLEECSEKIFPLNELYSAREKLQLPVDLNEIYGLLTTISKLKTQWKQEWLPVITKWHRVLFLFISDYKPSSVQDEKITYLANAKREIEETYHYQPLIQYLSSAVEMYVKNR